MEVTRFDRLTRRFGASSTRRSALQVLLATALLPPTAGSAAAKPRPHGRDQPHGTRKRRSKSQRRVSTQAHDRRNSAKAQGRPDNHCLTPDGVDLNRLWGISAQVVAPFCTEVDSGERWVSPGAPWMMNRGFATVPEGFVPAGATPLEDFIAKFAAITYVIDPGTPQEQTVVFPNSGAFFTEEEEGGLVSVCLCKLGPVHPLPVGPHVVDVFWEFDGMHCNGLGASIDQHCLAGDIQAVAGVAFEVTPQHH